ncbi:hypothetical protein D6D01_08683 [Aureobasidium pullulans]|uniref:Uncharacterized protein n=1 Tax=Aureobasidium pullulans TaxID=5580 RepID=A0A4S9K9P4_AURPU|nr:hypothetical protein D6D01_08683 [Aureobasidium pullulans]
MIPRSSQEPNRSIAFRNYPGTGVKNRSVLHRVTVDERSNQPSFWYCCTLNADLSYFNVFRTASKYKRWLQRDRMMVTSKIPVCTPSRIKSTTLDVSSRAGSNQSINNAIVRENEDLTILMRMHKAPNVDSALDATPDESDAVMVLFRQRFPDFPMDRTFTPEQKTYFGNYLAANHIPTASQSAANTGWQQLKTQSDLQGGITFEQQRQQQAAQAQRDAEEQVRMHAQRHSELNTWLIGAIRSNRPVRNISIAHNASRR